jgi:hypothetical protein
LLGFLLAISVECAVATTATFNVAAGEEQTRRLNLAADDRVLIHFTVTGGQPGSTLDFQIAYPNGTVENYGAVGIFDRSFVCDRDGEYVMHFSNAGSTESKLVSLDYEVEHYILGLPQMLFLALVVVMLCVGAVAAFILLGKKR